ncbi:MAG: helix-turn-helix transcriptional regulator [Candidatus Gracilibacteria bacterium]
MENKIKVYRAMNDLTQEGLAKKVGVTRQTIISIEKNKYVPSLELAFKISKIFSTSIEEVFIY